MKNKETREQKEEKPKVEEQKKEEQKRGGQEQRVQEGEGQEGSKKQGEGKKEVLVRGFPRGGVLIASRVGFGAKEFSARELESVIKLGVALENTPVRPLGGSWRRFSWPQICVFLPT